MDKRVFVSSSSSRSLDDFETQIRGLDMEIIPLRAAGTFSGHADALIGDSFMFTAGIFVSDHRYRGTSHPSHILLGISLGKGGRNHFGSNAGEHGDLSVLQPRQEHFGSVRGSIEYAALSIEASEIERLGIANGVMRSDVLLRNNTHIRPPDDVRAAACRELARLAGFAFQPASHASTARLEHLKRALLYPYLLVAAHGESQPDGLAPEWKTSIVRRGEKWVDGQPPERLHVIDLCSALGQPLRTVQRAFHDVLGMGPAHYLAFYRLQKVRQILLSCDPTATRTADVALDHGFWALGRFAGLYRRVYGEAPSETLRRRRS
jgi:AraC family ethanolamine operon transcriptional activator